MEKITQQNKNESEWVNQKNGRNSRIAVQNKYSFSHRLHNLVLRSAGINRCCIPTKTAALLHGAVAKHTKKKKIQTESFFSLTSLTTNSFLQIAQHRSTINTDITIRADFKREGGREREERGRENDRATEGELEEEVKGRDRQKESEKGR